MKMCFPLYQSYNPIVDEKIDFLKVSGPTYRGQVIDPQQQTPQGKSVAKPGTPLLSILVENTH